MTGDAILDAERMYRYVLWRTWDEAMGMVLWIMLNPSTADEREDDPTIRRIVGFSKAWGFGSAMVVNLFALRSKDPKALLSHPDPVGVMNDHVIWKAAEQSGKILVAWGNIGNFRNRAMEVATSLAALGHKLECLGVNSDGSPKHPLYIKADTQPVSYISAVLKAAH